MFTTFDKKKCNMHVIVFRFSSDFWALRHYNRNVRILSLSQFNTLFSYCISFLRYNYELSDSLTINRSVKITTIPGFWRCNRSKKNENVNFPLHICRSENSKMATNSLCGHLWWLVPNFEGKHIFHDVPFLVQIISNNDLLKKQCM